MAKKKATKKKKITPIQKMRKIVKAHKNYNMDVKPIKLNGVKVDVQTANMIVTVYDSLSAKNKKTFSKMTYPEMSGIGWELIKRSKKRK